MLAATPRDTACDMDGNQNTIVDAPEAGRNHDPAASTPAPDEPPLTAEDLAFLDWIRAGNAADCTDAVMDRALAATKAVLRKRRVDRRSVITEVRHLQMRSAVWAAMEVNRDKEYLAVEFVAKKSADFLIDGKAATERTIWNALKPIARRGWAVRLGMRVSFQ